MADGGWATARLRASDAALRLTPLRRTTGQRLSAGTSGAAAPPAGRRAGAASPRRSRAPPASPPRRASWASARSPAGWARFPHRGEHDARGRGYGVPVRAGATPSTSPRGAGGGARAPDGPGSVRGHGDLGGGWPWRSSRGVWESGSRTVGQTGTARVGTAGLLLPAARWSLAAAGGTTPSPL